MTCFDKRSAIAAIALATGLGAAVASTGGGLRCEVRQSTLFGMDALEALVRSDRNAEGSYSFTVVGANGATDIRQAGQFSVAPGSPAVLGKVAIGGGRSYDATLSVRADGRTVACDGRFAL